MKKNLYVLVILLVIVFSFMMGRDTFAKEVDNDIKLPVLMYHSIYARNCGEFVLSPTQLDNDIKYLQNSGYEFISGKQLIGYFESKNKLPKKPVMLTFDDGVYNNYTFAFDILKKNNVKAIISVVGKFTIQAEQEKGIQHSSYSSLNYAQILEMYNSGLVEIGNHTFDMHNVTAKRNASRKNKNESTEAYQKAIKEDFSKWQTLLYNNTGIKPNIFAFPYGRYSEEAFEVLNDLGIKLAFSCEQKINNINKNTNKYLIGRFNRPTGESSETFFSKRGIK